MQLSAYQLIRLKLKAHLLLKIEVIMKKQQGFTLLELSIIVAILVILALIVFGTH